MAKLNISSVALLGLLNACGATDNDTLMDEIGEIDPGVDSRRQDSFITQLGLSPLYGKIKVTHDTYFKVSTGQSGDLTASQKCYVSSGLELVFSALGEETSGHIEATLANPMVGCNLKTGYLYQNHIVIGVDVAVNHSIAAHRKTWFKSVVADSSTLLSDQLCELREDEQILLTAQAKEVGHQHLFLRLYEASVPSCNFREGYVFIPHMQEPRSLNQEEDFPRVMRHILTWEGRLL